MTRALVLIDIQNDYFAGGAFPLPTSEAAAANATALLRACREAGDRIVHVQHVWDAPDAEFFAPGTRGLEIHDAVAPQRGEALVTKAFPNAFRDTDLASHLEDIDELIVCGMMSNLCVDATVRAAGDHGYKVTVAHDSCAASDLSFDGVEVNARDVHAAFMAGLTEYAAVLPTATVIAGLAG